MFPLQKQMVNSYITSNCGFTGHILGRAGEMSARVPLPSTLASRVANPDPSDPIKRPQDLEYSTRRFHDVDDDGSLPNTPELECEASVSGDNSGIDALNENTREFLTNFFRNFVGISQYPNRDNKYMSTAKRVVNDVLEKHKITYNGMIVRLSLDDQGDDMSFVSSVAKSLFADGTTNWGRIVSLLAFGAAVCQDLKEKGRGHCVDLVSQEICTYLLSEQRNWLVNNNSWDGFVEFFRVSDPETTVRNTLVAFLGIAGVGALLAQLNMMAFFKGLPASARLHNSR
uniref:MCL1 apoptosis regulator, BCL2 family member b n=1 Tax=Oryzias sinensis TaxID=183150 RepID=A0A8C7X109_9TELE